MEEDKDVDQGAMAEEEVAGVGDAGGGAGSSGMSVLAKREGQEATALMMSKAIGEYGKGLTVRQRARAFLKTIASQILGGLLGRPQLSGSLDSKRVKEAIDGWIPSQGDVGGDVSRINATMRFAPSRAIRFRQLDKRLKCSDVVEK